MSYELPNIQRLETLDSILRQLLPKTFEASRDIDWRTVRLKEFIDHYPTRVRGNLDEVCKQLDLSISDRQVRKLFIKDSAGLGVPKNSQNTPLPLAALPM